MKPLIKCFTIFGALFILAFGLAVLAATIYLFFNDSIFLGNKTVQYTVLGVAFGASIAIISAAAEGIYGICKQRPKLICVFQVIVIVFVVIFIGLGVTLIFLPQIFFNGDCQTSSNIVIQYADQIYTTSYQMFCHTCPCALNNTTLAFNNTYSRNQRDIIAQYNLDPKGANDTIDCIINNVTVQEAALFTAVGQLQDFLDCSLWCPDPTENNLIYRFSNVNDGKPSNFCYSRLQTLYDDYSNIGKYCMFGAGGVMFLMFMCNMYICCCSEEKKGKGTAQRFMYIVDARDYQDRSRRNDRYDRYDRFEESRPMYFAVDQKRRR